MEALHLNVFNQLTGIILFRKREGLFNFEMTSNRRKAKYLFGPARDFGSLDLRPPIERIRFNNRPLRAVSPSNGI